MSSVQVPFDARLRRIVRQHQRVAIGARRVITKDGLIVARPRIYNPKFPLRGLVMLLVAAFLFKGYILASLGAADYNSRVATLAQGPVVEQAGAWIMQPDPLTNAVAGVMSGLGL